MIIVLYLRQNRLYEVEKKQEQLAGEMEELFSAYLIEMREENERFFKKVKEMQFNKTEDSLQKEESIGNESQKIHTTFRESDNSSFKHKESMISEEPSQYRKGNLYQVAQAYKNSYKPQEDAGQDPNSNSSFPQKEEPKEKIIEEPHLTNKEGDAPNSPIFEALLLKKQGLSITEIAKKMNKGKTEIELLLKFQEKQ